MKITNSDVVMPSAVVERMGTDSGLRFAICTILLVLCALGPFDGALQAQNYLTSTGPVSSAAPYPTELGFVDAGSGNLHLEIPLGTFAQRKTNAPVVPKLLYDSHFWTVYNDGITSEWLPIGGETGQWSLSEGNYTSVIPIPGTTICNNDWEIVDTTGVRRYFHIATTQVGNNCTAGSAYATDSSGFLLQVTSTDIALQNYTTIYQAPDGTQSFPDHSNSSFAPIYLDAEDSNGNYVSQNCNSVTGCGPFLDTLGRAMPPLGLTGNTFSVPNSQNSVSTDKYTINRIDIPIKTKFAQAGIVECGAPSNPCSMQVTTSIVLPDGTQFSFLYDCDSTTGNLACNSPGGQTAYYGELTSMTLPTGQTITYTYSNFTDVAGNVGRWLTGKTTGTAIWSFSPVVTSSGGWKTTYPCASGASVDGCQQVTVSRPDGSKDIATFVINNGAWPSTVQSYDTDGATLLSTVVKTWDFSQPCVLNICSSHGSQFVRNLRIYSTLPAPTSGNITKQVAYAYDSPQKGNATTIQEWTFRNGTASTAVFPSLADTTSYVTYATIGTNNNINRPLTQTVCNNLGTDSNCPGGGSKVSRTMITYDNYGAAGGNCLTSLTSVAGIVSHNDTNFGCSYTARGNPTQISSWVSGTTYLTTSLTYDTTGQVLTVVDPKGNTSTKSYIDKFYADSGTNPPATFTPKDSSGNNITTNAYVTKVTSPIGSTTAGYYYGSGHPALATDYNAVATYSHYIDPFDRSTETDAPIGWSLSKYTSPTQVDIYSAVGDAAASSGCTSCVHAQGQLDTLGRLSNQYAVNNPAGQVSSNTRYDGMNQTSSASHLNFGTSDPNDVYEASHYDGLGRSLGITHPDGQFTHTAYGPAVTALRGLAAQQNAAYGVGFPVLSVDEAGKLRQQWLDGFGRIIEVDEPSGGTGLSSPLVTNYAYDALGHLTKVVQGVQSRTYQYDGLSRLTMVATPEASTGSVQNPVTLSYVTTTGALCSGNPSNPCRRTDARGIVTTYTYSTSNRLTRKTHTPNTTGTVIYAYGTSAASFNKGRLLSITDPSGSETYTYDQVGRIINLAKVITGTMCSATTPCNIGYAYNPGDQLTQVTYPSGRVVRYSYDSVGHLCVVAASVNPNCGTATTPYLTILSSNYDAAGRPLTATYGNGVVANATYSPQRSQLATLSYTKGTKTLFSLNYFYQLNSTNCPTGNTSDNGQIQCIGDLVQPGRSIRYTYDFLGRLSTANTVGSASFPAWGLSETYDRYGNRSAQSVTAGSGPSTSFTINPINNQITSPSFTYDASGHVTVEPSPLTASYTYDGEECLTSYAGAAASATYTCDGNGQRVQKVVTGTGAVNTVYIYSGGQVIAEYDDGVAMTSPTREYIFGNQRLAKVAGSTSGTGGTITYEQHDHLSPRLYTNATGIDVGDQATYPFGEPGSSNAASNWVFTTYERDAESGNDNALARSYSSSFGRFQSPDPVEGNPGNPQSWNRYAYVGNDPINITDPSGQNWVSDLGAALLILSDFFDGGAGTALGLVGSTLVNGGAASTACDSACPNNTINADVVFNAPLSAGGLSGPPDMGVGWGVFQGWGGAVYKGVEAFSKTFYDVVNLGVSGIYDTVFKGPVDLLKSANENVCGADGGACAGLPFIGAPFAAAEEIPAAVEELETLPMTIVKILPPGTARGVLNEAKSLTWTTGNEHALVRLSSGARALVSGGPGGIEFAEGQVTRIIGHTHPWTDGFSGPSALDRAALNQLGQTHSYVVERGVIIRF